MLNISSFIQRYPRSHGEEIKGWILRLLLVHSTLYTLIHIFNRLESLKPQGCNVPAGESHCYLPAVLFTNYWTNLQFVEALKPVKVVSCTCRLGVP